MGFLDLFVIGTNLTKQTSEIFSYSTTPNMKIKDALRLSMSIPFYFQANKIKKDTYTDGGIILNYPINIFDNVKYLFEMKNGKKESYNKEKGFIFNNETIGFRLDSKDEFFYNSKGWKNTPKKINNIKDYTTSLINILLESANKRHLHKNDWNRTIFIDTLGIKTTDFDLSKDESYALIESGKKGVRDYFRWRGK